MEYIVAFNLNKCEIFWPSGDPTFQNFLRFVIPYRFLMVWSCWMRLVLVPNTLIILLLLFSTMLNFNRIYLEDRDSTSLSLFKML